jgi:hypothetical protein
MELTSLMPSFSMKVEVIRTIEYELSPPWYDLLKSCFCSSFFTIITIDLKSLYFSCNSLILYID